MCRPFTRLAAHQLFNRKISQQAQKITGTRDLFLSDTVRVHRKMRVAGVVADLNVYEGVSHGDYAFVVDSPELQQVYGELGVFLLKHLQ